MLSPEGTLHAVPTTDVGWAEGVGGLHLSLLVPRHPLPCWPDVDQGSHAPSVCLLMGSANGWPWKDSINTPSIEKCRHGGHTFNASTLEGEASGSL